MTLSRLERPEKSPRYYQVNAINAAIEAIGKGKDRILLVMATGTGKTSTSVELVGAFDSKLGFEHAVHELQTALYEGAA